MTEDALDIAAYLREMADCIMKVRRTVVGHHVFSMLNIFRAPYLSREEYEALQVRLDQYRKEVIRMIGGLPVMYQSYFDMAESHRSTATVEAILRAEAHAALLVEGEWIMTRAAAGGSLRDEPEYQWSEDDAPSLDDPEPEEQ